MRPEVIVDLLYKLFLFREADESGMLGKVNRIRKLGVENALVNVVSGIISSEEKRIKTYQEPLSFYPFEDDEEGRGSLNQILVILNKIPRCGEGDVYLNFLAAEVNFSLGEFEKARKYYQNLKLNSNPVVKKISTGRYYQSASSRLGDVSDNFTQQRLAELALNDWHIDSLGRLQEGFEKQTYNKLDLAKFLSFGVYNSDAVADIMGEYIKASAGELPPSMAVEMVRLCCLLKGIDERNAEVLSEAFEFSYKKKNKYSQKDKSKDVVVVGGFHWSGSSAVYDFFKDTGKLSAISIEASNYVNGLGRILNRKNKKIGLIEYFLIHLLNVYVSGQNRGSKRPNFSLLANCLRQGENKINFYSYAVKDFMSEVTSSEGEYARESLVSLLYKCCDINPGTGRLALDQAPTAMNVKALKNLPTGAKYIAVFRDPRDLYVEQVGKKAIERGVYSDVYGFIEKYLKDRDQYFTMRETLSGSYLFMETYFENFVMNESERRRVAEYAGVEFKENKKYFNPEKSINNVGKYKRYADQASIKIIEERLGDYIREH